jgi:hypothetical protein
MTPAEARLGVRNGTLPSGATDFRDDAGEICLECHRIRDAGRSISPFLSAEGYFKRECYLLIRSSLRRDSKAIKTLSKYDWRYPPQPLYTDNPFYWGLLAIDPDHQFVTQRDLNFLSQQLLHAHRHNVPVEYLVGFIYQCGSQSALRSKVRHNLREEDFDMVRNRASVKRTSII